MVVPEGTDGPLSDRAEGGNKFPLGAIPFKSFKASDVASEASAVG